MHKTQRFVWVAAAGSIALAGCSTLGQQIKSGGAMGSGDTAYINTAYELAQLDNAAGKLVPAKASDPRVVDVSHQLVAQANALSPGLVSALKSQGITPPSQPPASIAAELDRLNSLNGPDFDKAYVNDEIALHQQAVKVFKAESANTKNSEMREQVDAELPAVQDDLEKLQSLHISNS